MYMTKLSRLTVAALVTMAAPGVIAANAAEVIVGTFGGAGQTAMEETWFKPFTAATGINVVSDAPTSYTKVIEMVDNHDVQWDISFGARDFGYDGNPRLENIDCAVIDCKAFDTALVPLMPQAVPVYSFSYVLVYNTDLFGDNPPKNWADFFDTTNFPGKRAVGGAVTAGRGIIEPALLADGVARADIYPLDLDRALNKLGTIKDDLIVWNDFADCTAKIASGEASMGACVHARVAPAVKDGAPIAIQWSQQIMHTVYGYILKDAPNLADAQKLLAYIASPEAQAAFSAFSTYGSPNPSTVLPADVDSTFIPSAHYLTGDDAPLASDDEEWAPIRTEFTERYTLWLVS